MVTACRQVDAVPTHEKRRSSLSSWWRMGQADCEPCLLGPCACRKARSRSSISVLAGDIGEGLGGDDPTGIACGKGDRQGQRGIERRQRGVVDFAEIGE